MRAPEMRETWNMAHATVTNYVLCVCFNAKEYFSGRGGGERERDYLQRLRSKATSSSVEEFLASTIQCETMFAQLFHFVFLFNSFEVSSLVSLVGVLMSIFVWRHSLHSVSETNWPNKTVCMETEVTNAGNSFPPNKWYSLSNYMLLGRILPFLSVWVFISYRRRHIILSFPSSVTSFVHCFVASTKRTIYEPKKKKQEERYRKNEIGIANLKSY